MSVFTYHIVKLSCFSAGKMMFFPMRAKHIDGLIHAETMSIMTLGSPIYSFSRIFNRKVVVFAQWENEKAIHHFLDTNPLGRKLIKGWYVKMKFIRQWGSISGFKIPKLEKVVENQNDAVVAVTIARMKYLEVPRFIRWGRPVEKLVRDHSGTTMSLASIRYPNTISTFSIWKTQKEMNDMVYGNSTMPNSKRHMNAMKERNRKNFHYEFTTLRFKPIAEYGVWNNKSNFIPIKNEA